MNTFVFLVAAVVLLAAQSAVIAREVKAARSHDGNRGQSLDAAWAALPGLLILALLAFSLYRVFGD